MGKPTGEAVVQAAIRLVDRSYDEMDCQGMIEEAVRKAGGSMSYSGSNAMARAVSGLTTLKEAKKAGLRPGMALFIHEDGGDYPKKYHADGLGNFSHVGLYAGEDALIDTDKYGKPRSCNVVHSSDTMGRVAGSTLQNGWTHAGYFREIEYGDGDSAAPVPSTPPSSQTLGSRTLKKGDKGDDVAALQSSLLLLDYHLGNYGVNKDGVDGSFGAKTDTAVRSFQSNHGLEIDGKYGKKSHAAMLEALAKLGSEPDETPVEQPEAPKGTKILTIVCDNNGKVNLRAGDSTEYGSVGQVDPGTELGYVVTSPATGWHGVRYKERIAWVSPKYAEVTTG